MKRVFDELPLPPLNGREMRRDNLAILPSHIVHLCSCWARAHTLHCDMIRIFASIACCAVSVAVWNAPRGAGIHAALVHQVGVRLGGWGAACPACPVVVGIAACWAHCDACPSSVVGEGCCRICAFYAEAIRVPNVSIAHPSIPDHVGIAIAHRATGALEHTERVEEVDIRAAELAVLLIVGHIVLWATGHTLLGHMVCEGGPWALAVRADVATIGCFALATVSHAACREIVWSGTITVGAHVVGVWTLYLGAHRDTLVGCRICPWERLGTFFAGALTVRGRCPRACGDTCMSDMVGEGASTALGTVVVTIGRMPWFTLCHALVPCVVSVFATGTVLAITMNTGTLACRACRHTGCVRHISEWRWCGRTLDAGICGPIRRIARLARRDALMIHVVGVFAIRAISTVLVAIRCLAIGAHGHACWRGQCLVCHLWACVAVAIVIDTLTIGAGVHTCLCSLVSIWCASGTSHALVVGGGMACGALRGTLVGARCLVCDQWGACAAMPCSVRSFSSCTCCDASR